MWYLLATYIREDKLYVTRSAVLYEGTEQGAFDAMEQELDAHLDDGCTLIAEDENASVVRHESRIARIKGMYTIVLQVYHVEREPFYNE